MAKRQGTGRMSKQQEQRMYDTVMAGVMACAPIMKREDAWELDRQMCGAGRAAVARRLGLAIASHGGEWFKQIAEDRSMAVTIAGQLEAVEVCAAAMRELADVMEVAATRVRIALCAHPDVEAIMAESEGAAVVHLPAEAAGTA